MTPVHVLRFRTARRAAGLAVVAAAFVMLWSVSPARADRGGYAYLSPLPGARLVSPMSTIVLRDGRALDASSVRAGLVSAAGTVTGVHAGRLALARDGRTVVFRPDAPFALGETVTVSLASGLRAADGTALAPFTWTFEVARAHPRDQMHLRAAMPEFGGGATSQAGPETAASLETHAACTDPPDNFAPYNIRTYNNPDPGYLFLSPFVGFNAGNITIIDNFGQPIFNRHFPYVIHDFSAQPNGLLTYFATTPPTGNPKYFALDNTFAVVDSFDAGNGYVPDTHDLLFRPNGNYLLMIYDPQPVDMSLVVPGGDPSAIVTGLVIQELDPDRNVVFEWRSWDHFQITDFIETTGSLTSDNIDYVHGNALDVMPDGNLLLCSRHMNEITKIDRQTGDVLWRMGSNAKNNQFTFVGDPRGFSHQHDARWLPNGHLTVFDNGNFITPQRSRFVEYAVDEVGKVATEVREFIHTPAIFTGFMGSARRQQSGRTVVGWGGAFSLAKVTELNPDGSVALELGAAGNVLSYRAVRSTWRGGLLVTDATSVDFGVVNVGETGSRQLTVRNGSDDDLTIGCFTSSDGAFSVTTSLPLTLPAGGEATLDLAFAPGSAGAKAGRIYLRVPGTDTFVAQDVDVSGVGNLPPDCSGAVASRGSLWPPNHKFTDISIEGVTDPEGDDVTIELTGITQNEPLNDVGDGNTCPDAEIVDGAARVRAERSAQGDGRLYRIAFHAEDVHGAGCDGTVDVFVPHDQGDPPPPPPTAAPAGPDHREDALAGTAVSWEFVDALGPCPKKHDKPDPEPSASEPAPTTWTLSLKAFEAAGSRATVEFTLADDGDARLAIFDLSGRRVRTLQDGRMSAGPHRVEWSTAGLSPGVYFYRLRAGEASLSRMIRIIR